MKKPDWKIRLVILCLAITATVIVIACSSSQEDDQGVISKLGLTIKGLDQFTIKKNILREGKEISFQTIIAEKDACVIKIEAVKNIDPKPAEEYVAERKYAIFSLFQNVSSAYPGMITNKVDSPSKYKPEIREIEMAGETLPVYLLHSTARFTYGATSDDLIKYRGAVTFVYNPNTRSLYRIDIFIPKIEYQERRILQWLGTIRFIAHDLQTEKAAPAGKKHTGTEKDQLRKAYPAAPDNWRFKDHNLLIIGFEPLGSNHVSAYGYAKKTTPNFDRFAQDAFLFKNAISPSSWTLPAFMSWFTSLYPSQHKIINKYNRFVDQPQKLSKLSELSPNVETLAQILKKEGYTTAGFTGGAAVSGHFGYDIGFDVYGDDTTFGGFDLSMPQALEWLKGHSREKFFLFVQGFDVHGRYSLPVQYENTFLQPGYKGKYHGSVEEYWQLRNSSVDNTLPGISVSDVRFWESNYDAKIFEADSRFGTFIAGLEKLGILKNTIVVISSGSGNEFYEHKKFDHGLSLYEELVHVPLIIKIPGKYSGNIHSQVRTLDIMPTVIELLNVDTQNFPTQKMQGASLVPMMRGKKIDLPAFSETDYLLQVFKRSLRTNDGWKYIYSIDTEQRELFNLNEDPGELNNLIYHNRRTAYELEQKLFKHLTLMKQSF